MVDKDTQVGGGPKDGRDTGELQVVSTGPQLPPGVEIAWIPDPRERWQYTLSYVAGNAQTLEDKLNQMGNQGWDLVGIEGSTATFKRRLMPLPIRVDEDGNVLGPAGGPASDGGDDQAGPL